LPAGIQLNYILFVEDIQRNIAKFPTLLSGPPNNDRTAK